MERCAGEWGGRERWRGVSGGNGEDVERCAGEWGRRER